MRATGFWLALGLAFATYANADDLLHGAIDVTAGSGFSCAVLDDGTVACWGANYSGQLGNGSTAQSNVPTRVITDVSSRRPLSNVTAVSAGMLNACALQSDGDVYCWGAAGTTGNAAIAPSIVAQRAVIDGAVAVSVGDDHACALLGNASHSVKCWGGNGDGQLGDGSFLPHDLPVDVVVTQQGGARIPLTDVVQISAGGTHTCALRADSTAACWGANQRGQLGNGGTADATSPTSVAITFPDHSQTVLSGIAQIAAGRYHSCLRFVDNTAACWGDNQYGELGVPTAPSIEPSPVGIFGAPPMFALASGDDFSCSIIANGHVMCWGRNESGQFGTGDSRSYPTPAYASNLIVATKFATGHTHNCYIAPDRTVRCLGGASTGELGGGFAGTPRLSPVTVLRGTIGDDIFADGLQPLQD